MSENWNIKEVGKSAAETVKKKPWLVGGGILVLGGLWYLTRPRTASIAGYPQYPQAEEETGGGGGGGGGGSERDDAALLDAFGKMLYEQSNLIAGSINHLQQQPYQYPLQQEIIAYEPKYQQMDLGYSVASSYGPYAPGGIAVRPEFSGLDNKVVNPRTRTTQYTEYVRASIVSSPTVASAERPTVATGQSKNAAVTAAEKAAGPGHSWNRFGELVRS